MAPGFWRHDLGATLLTIYIYRIILYNGIMKARKPMTQKEKIKELIDIAALLTNRIKKVEQDCLIQRRTFLDLSNKLEKRIIKLEADNG